MLSDCRAWSRDAAAIGGHAKYAPVLELQNGVGIEAGDMGDQRAVTLGKRGDGCFLSLSMCRECRAVSVEIAAVDTNAHLCSMFNDAASVKAGRLIDRNPFQKLGISRGKGRRDQQPPTEQKVWEMIAHARKLACPSFAAWLQVAAFTGLRPGELDALRWERIDFDRHRIVVAEQFSAATRAFDTPKNHLRRESPLTAHARDALLGLARDGEFCFVSLRGEHWTPSSRAYNWKAVRAAAGWEGSLYLATRHFAGWYMVNELEMSSEDVAIALGHQDGGNLVRRLYGHRDKGRALDRIIDAYATRAENRPKRQGSSMVATSQQTLFGDTYV